MREKIQRDICTWTRKGIIMMKKEIVITTRKRKVCSNSFFTLNFLYQIWVHDVKSWRSSLKCYIWVNKVLFVLLGERGNYSIYLCLRKIVLQRCNWLCNCTLYYTWCFNKNRDSINSNMYMIHHMYHAWYKFNHN